MSLLIKIYSSHIFFRNFPINQKTSGQLIAFEYRVRVPLNQTVYHSYRVLIQLYISDYQINIRLLYIQILSLSLAGKDY